MWIVIRILVACAAFVARAARGTRVPGPAGDFHGTPYFEVRQRNRIGRVIRVRIGMRLAPPVAFRLHRESWIDRAAKWAGVATEAQTGDAAFDEAVYVACDHPAFARMLREDAAARRAVRSAFALGFTRIWSDHDVVWMDGKGDSATQQALQALRDLRERLAKLPASARRLRDPYVARFVAVEAVTWSIFAYGVTGLLEVALAPHERYPDLWPVVAWGLAIAAGLFVVLAAATVALLRGSSRGHRVLVEGILVLVIGLPMAGAQLAMDVNDTFDFSPGWRATAHVLDRRDIRRSRGANTCHLFLRAADTAAPVPKSLEIPLHRCGAIGRGGRLALHLSTGPLGITRVRRVDRIPGP